MVQLSGAEWSIKHGIPALRKLQCRDEGIDNIWPVAGPIRNVSYLHTAVGCHHDKFTPFLFYEYFKR